MGVECQSTDCVDTSATASSNGLPYLILIITLVLCSILLATIALIIIVVITRDRRKRHGLIEERSVSYDDVVKPGLSTVEVQPDLRTLDLRGNKRGAFMPYAQAQSRRFGPQGQFCGQRRLIPVPEEDGHFDESRHMRDDLLNVPTYGYNNGNLGDADGEGEFRLEDETFHGASGTPLREERYSRLTGEKQEGTSNSET